MTTPAVTAPALESQATSVPRLEYLDGMRGAAALYVVLHHIERHLVIDSRPVRLFSGLFYFGHYAVSVFIVLSGFCLMLPVVRGDGKLRGGLTRFFQRRAKRILPPYYLALLLSLLLIATLIGGPTETWWRYSIEGGITRSDLWSHLLLLQDYLGGTKINYVFWSVATEWHLYFLFPLFVWMFQRVGAVQTTLLFLLISFGITLFTLRQDWHFEMLGQFVLGSFGAYIGFSREARWKEWRERVSFTAIALAGLVAMGVFGFLGRHRYGITILLEPLLGIVTVALMLHALRPGPNLLRSLLEWKPLIAIGGFSYSLYLVHAPMIQLLWLTLVRPLHRSSSISFLLLLLPGTLFILGAAWVFARFGERPFLNRPENRPADAPLRGL